MTRLWATAHPNIFFASMHPGWADTPGVCVCVRACVRACVSEQVCLTDKM